MAIKLTLDLPALERLIGGDSEIELELRNGIASTFADKYLRQVINETSMRELESRMKEYAKSEVNSFVAKTDSWKRATEITGTLEKLIKNSVHDNISELVRNECDKYLEWAKEASKKQNQIVDKWLEKTTKEYIEAEVKKKFEIALGLIK
jgi:hypothetical protein